MGTEHLLLATAASALAWTGLVAWTAWSARGKIAAARFRELQAKHTRALLDLKEASARDSKRAKASEDMVATLRKQLGASKPGGLSDAAGLLTLPAPGGKAGKTPGLGNAPGLALGDPGDPPGPGAG